MTRYLPLLEQLDAWHAAADRAHPGIIPCRTGCSACCHGPFDVSIADAHLVSQAIAALPEEVRLPIVVRATAQMEQVRELAPEFDSPWDVSTLTEDAFDAICEALAEEPCPALDSTGRCAIYSFRPLVCRIMGLGLLSSGGGEIPNACPIQEDFPDYATLPPQPFDLPAWEQAEAGALTAAAVERTGNPAAASFETTVAGAILMAAASPRSNDVSGP